MPHREDAVFTPNDQLRAARLQQPSPRRPDRRMSRAELADAVNAAIDRANTAGHNVEHLYVAQHWVGKLERGITRWPQAARRAALCQVLGATESDLGLYMPRMTDQDATVSPARPEPAHHGGAGRPALLPTPYPTALQAAMEVAASGEGGFHPARTDEQDEPPTSTRGTGPAEDLVDVLSSAMEIVVRGVVTTPLQLRIEHLIPSVSIDVPRRIGTADVARIEATTSAFREWDNRWGGGLSRAAVLAQLQWVAACALRSSCSSETVQRRLLTALADLAGVAAFLSYDVNRQAQARALWMVGLNAASEAGNVDLVGTTLRQLAHQCLHLQRPDEALKLIRLSYTAAVDPDHHPSELALAEIAAYEGWCFAAAGKRQPCHRALGRAEEHFANADDEQPPPWLSHLDLAELTALRGHAYHVLAHHFPDVATQARPLLRDAVAGRDDPYARSKTLNLMALAGTYFQQGENLEEGVAVGDQALVGTHALTSPRALDRLRDLHQLASRHSGVEAVQHFVHRIDAVLADA